MEQEFPIIGKTKEGETVIIDPKILPAADTLTVILEASRESSSRVFVSVTR